MLDRNVAGKRILDIAKRIAGTNVDIVQFRDKHSSDREFFSLANRIKKILNKKQLFIINDRVDIAQALDVDGLHLGQDDLEPERARRIFGANKIIGLSCHDFTQVKKAEKDCIDYISIGPIFSTPIKPDYKVAGLALAKKTREYARKPFFAIGGINLKNVNKIAALGIKRIAVCRLICKARNIKNTINALRKKVSS